MDYSVFKGLNYIMVILMRGYLMSLDEATCLLGLRLSVLCHSINTWGAQPTMATIASSTSLRHATHSGRTLPFGLGAQHW